MPLVRQERMVVAVKPEATPPRELPESSMAKERAKAYEAVGEIMKLHRASEYNARWAAVRTALRFRDQGTRKMAQARVPVPGGGNRWLLEEIAEKYGIHECHVQLFVDVVQCLCKMLPVTHDEERQEILAAFQAMERM